MKLPTVDAKWIALIGVGTGWVLNEASAVIRGRRERRQQLGKVLSRLMSLRNDISTLAMILENQKRIDFTPENFEAARQRFRQRYIKDSDDVAKKMQEIIDSLAATLPFEAFELQQTWDRFLFSKKIKLAVFSTNKEAYIRMLSTIETTEILYVRRLDRITSAVSWRLGLWNRLKLELHRRRLRGGIKKAEKLATEITDSVLRDFEEAAKGEAAVQKP